MNDIQLADLSDEQLISYIVRARDAAHPSAVAALQVLVYGYFRPVTALVRAKIPEHDVEEVAARGIESAVKSALRAAFKGSTIGEFRSWLYTIVRARIADYYRSGSLKTVPLVSEHDDDETMWGREPAVDDDLAGELDVQAAIDRAFMRLSPPHVRVVDLFVFDGLPAAEVAAQINAEFGEQLSIPMSESNVHQVASRFRKDLRSELPDNQG